MMKIRKNKFFDLIKRNDGNQCGITAQDVSGTIKGNWFHENIRDNIAEWDKFLSFVNDNERPEIQVVSIGGVFTSPQKLEFTPTKLGTKNRDFVDVKPDGKTYCYEGQNSQGSLVVQLTTEFELKIEKQNGACSGDLKFSKPSIYKR